MVAVVPFRQLHGFGRAVDPDHARSGQLADHPAAVPIPAKGIESCEAGAVSEVAAQQPGSPCIPGSVIGANAMDMGGCLTLAAFQRKVVSVGGGQPHLFGHTEQQFLPGNFILWGEHQCLPAGVHGGLCLSTRAMKNRLHCSQPGIVGKAVDRRLRVWQQVGGGHFLRALEQVGQRLVRI
ncbi:hypothetical protein FQZ97_845860 [compost metagenome]